MPKLLTILEVLLVVPAFAAAIIAFALGAEPEQPSDKYKPKRKLYHVFRERPFLLSPGPIVSLITAILAVIMILVKSLTGGAGNPDPMLSILRSSPSPTPGQYTTQTITEGLSWRPSVRAATPTPPPTNTPSPAPVPPTPIEAPAGAPDLTQTEIIEPASIPPPESRDAPQPTPKLPELPVSNHECLKDGREGSLAITSPEEGNTFYCSEFGQPQILGTVAAKYDWYEIQFTDSPSNEPDIARAGRPVISGKAPEPMPEGQDYPCKGYDKNRRPPNRICLEDLDSAQSLNNAKLATWENSPCNAEITEPVIYTLWIKAARVDKTLKVKSTTEIDHCFVRVYIAP